MVQWFYFAILKWQLHAPRLHRNSRRPRVKLELDHCYKSLTNMKSWRYSATARYNRKDSRRPHLPEQLNLPLAIKRRSIGTSLGISETWLGAELEISSVSKEVWMSHTHTEHGSYGNYQSKRSSTRVFAP